MTTMAIPISINNCCNYLMPFAINEWIERICSHLNLHIEHFELTLLAPSDIQKMNHQFFSNNMATDTITFNLDSQSNIIADIYVCPNIIQENAHIQQHAIEKEFKIVIIHSILHLIGYTDTTESTFAEMNNKQIQIYHQLESQS
tara:strand:- start:3183 stop:3614 length:432 start_codon:yes stop_codon:yes gene_type:complete